MTVCTDHAAVKADILCLECGNCFQLCGNEIVLGDAVLFVKDSHDIELYLFAYIIISERTGTDENVQLFTLEYLAGTSLHLVLSKVGEKVGNAEYRVAFVLADVYLYGAAVSTDNYAVKCKRDSAPLILLDSAVVMGLEVSGLLVFKERVLLHIKTGRVNVSGCNMNALFHRLPAYDRKDNCLASVVVINLVAGFKAHISLKFLVACLLGSGNCEIRNLSLDL